jgi:hypothetical protein
MNRQITAADFQRLRAALGQQAEEDIAWAKACCPPKNEEEFALEAIFVICNSGMKNTVARQIYECVLGALFSGKSAGDAFGHKGKAAAIDHIWRHQGVLYVDYLLADDKLAFCESLPWIGGITKYHLAKNFGADVAKPDVHLQRLADREGCTAQQLCERLAAETGLRVAAVDTVLWRACADGVLNSRTGEIT